MSSRTGKRLLGVNNYEVGICAALIIFSGAFLSQLIFGPTLNRAGEVSIERIVNSSAYLPIYALFWWYLLSKIHIAIDFSKYGLFFLVFALLGLASMAWALNVQRTAIEGIQLLATIGTAVGLAATTDSERFVSLTAGTLLLILLASLMYIFLLPSWGLMSVKPSIGAAGLVVTSQLEGIPQGVFRHKNTLGDAASLGVFAAVAGWRILSPKLAMPLILAAASCLVLSQSVAKILGCVAAMLVFSGCFALRHRPVMRARCFMLIVLGLLVINFALVLGVATLPQYESPVAELIGKGSSLSARGHIWSHSLPLIEARPMLGYGLGSIWNTELGVVPEFWWWQPKHAHNALVEVSLMLGASGVLVALAALQRVAITAIKPVNNQLFSAQSFLLMLLVALLVRSSFDLSLFVGNQLSFFVLLVLFCHVASSRASTSPPKS